MSGQDNIWSEAVLASHAAWVANDPHGVRLVMTGIDLSGLRPGGLVLVAVRFEDCTFRGTRFVDLCLNQAELVRCDFGGAVMNGVELREARLEDCGFVEASLNGADLVGAVISGGDWNRASLTDADLTAVDIDGASFMQVALDRSRLVKSTWVNTRLSSSCLDRVDMRDADLEAVDLRACDIDGVVLNNTRWDRCGVHGIKGIPRLMGRGMLPGQVDRSPSFDGTDLADVQGLASQAGWPDELANADVLSC